MRIKSYTDIQAFKKDTADFLMASRKKVWANNFILRVIKAVEIGRYHQFDFVTVIGERGVEMAAARTPPMPLVFSDGNKEAIPLILSHFGQAVPPLSGLNGPKEISDAAAKIWGQETGSHPTIGKTLSFYVLTKVISVPSVPGELYLATQKDVEWVADQKVNFAIETNLFESEKIRDVKKIAEEIEKEQIYLWMDQGRPVLFLRAADIEADGVHVTTVYTLPDYRKCGYASYALAQFCQEHVVAQGKWASLFANAANRTANKVYQAIGFEHKLDYQSYALE